MSVTFPGGSEKTKRPEVAPPQPGSQCVVLRDTRIVALEGRFSLGPHSFSVPKAGTYPSRLRGVVGCFLALCRMQLVHEQL